MPLIRAVARVIGREARAVNNAMGDKVVTKGGGLSYYGPTMNIYRDPRWGRGQESVSEDPLLNGNYAVEFIRGIQENDDGVYLTVAGACKHIAAYSFEGQGGSADDDGGGGDDDGSLTRHNFDALVSPLDMNETYLPAFRQCVVDAAPQQQDAGLRRDHQSDFVIDLESTATAEELLVEKDLDVSLEFKAVLLVQEAQVGQARVEQRAQLGERLRREGAKRRCGERCGEGV